MKKMLVILGTAAIVAGCSGCSTTEQQYVEPTPAPVTPTPDTTWNDLSSGLDLQRYSLEK